jgi:hypothetical protein
LDHFLIFPCIGNNMINIFQRGWNQKRTKQWIRQAQWSPLFIKIGFTESRWMANDFLQLHFHELKKQC